MCWIYIYTYIVYIYGFSILDTIHSFSDRVYILYTPSQSLFVKRAIIILVLLFTCYSVSKFRLTLCHITGRSTPGSAVLCYLWSLLRFMSVESVMLSDHLTFCHPFCCLLSCLASGSFPVNRLFTSSGQSIGASASATILLLFTVKL